MRRHALSMVVFAFLALMGAAWAGEDKAPPQVRLEIDLVDGSHIVGIPGIESVSVQTSYAKMDVPVKQILAITMGGDHETASIGLRNGDKLNGVVGLGPIKLDTIFGKVSIGIEPVRAIDVVLSGEALVEWLRNGLILYYSFDRDEGEKVTDKSGRGNQVTTHGAKWTEKGKVGAAYQFLGGSESGDWIEAEDSTGLSSPQGTRQLSICLWMKPDSLPRFIPDLVCKGGNWPPNATDGYELYINSVGRQDFGLCSSTREAFTTGNWLGGHLGEWMHVAVTLDAATGKVTFYVNGADTRDVGGDTDWSGANLAVKNNLYIGRPDPGHHDNRAWFDGTIDEVMVFNRVLTGEEVKSIYGANK